jgi:hypothetical protein
MSRTGILLPFALVAVLAVGFLPAFAQPSFDFMPDGGRGLLRQLFGGERGADLGAEVATGRTAPEWKTYLGTLGSTLTARQIDTLAGYLSVTAPVDAARLAAAAAQGDPAMAFPPDGKELAIASCQSCHSMFSGYLMQDRDAQGWRSIFLSPFHRELHMTDQERTIFVLYSTTNMPLKYDDVPPDLRF